MREIKFRMYEKKTKKMYDVERINFKDHLLNMWNSRFYSSSLFNFKDVELMQFTGLHDKNGKEIYEGDIVQHLYEFSDVTDRYLIDYDEDDLSYAFQNISNKNRFIALEDLYDEDYGDYAIEVIGNIYENPELLERS